MSIKKTETSLLKLNRISQYLQQMISILFIWTMAIYFLNQIKITQILQLGKEYRTMRKSCIQAMRKSRISSQNYSTSSNADLTFDGFAKSKMGRRLTLNQMGRVVTERDLGKLVEQKVLYEPLPFMRPEKQSDIENVHKIPEYEFLKNKQELQNDPFLKAKMKYLVNKQKPNLIKNMLQTKVTLCEKKNTENIKNLKSEFSTLKKENRKQNNKKLFLLTNSNQQLYKVNE